MELTRTQRDLITMILTNTPKHVQACRMYRVSGYKDKSATEHSQYLFTSVKNAFKAIIYEWLEAKGITASIRSELRIRLDYPDLKLLAITLGATSIFNDKGGLPGNKSRWINKITVDTRGPRELVRIRSHKARTDPDFLEPTATEFCALIQAISDALKQ